MTSKTFLDDLRPWPQRLAPELRSAVPIIAQPAELPYPPDATAYVVHHQCASLQQFIPGRRWIGPVIVFVRMNLSREQALLTLVHELAHILPYRAPAPSVEVTPAVVDQHRAELADYWAKLDAPTKPQPAWLAEDHGKKFTRIALHLWWRAALAGEMLTNLDALCAGRRFDLSPAGLYWRALGAEPVKMQHASFDEILSTAPPKLFTDLWTGDLARWMSLHPEAVKETMKEVA